MRTPIPQETNQEDLPQEIPQEFYISLYVLGCQNFGSLNTSHTRSNIAPVIELTSTLF